MNADQILDAARAHFDKQRAQKIEVPEWDMVGDNAATFDPPSLRRRQQIQHLAGKSEARQLALAVILCVKNKDGAMLFQNDAPTLAALENQVDPAVLARIAKRVLGLSEESDLGN